MIRELRSDFNRRFTKEKYGQFLAVIASRSGTEVKFRLSETPCFFPASLVRTMEKAGAELVHQLVDSQTYLQAARKAIPEPFLAPNEAKKPLFLQVDFGLIRDGNGAIVPRLVEIQAFPSLYAFQPVLDQTYRDVYELDTPISGASALVREAILGRHDPENVILLEIDPWRQKTLPDFLLTERLTGIKTVDIRDVKKQGRKLYANGIRVDRIYNRAIADELVRRDIQSDFRFTDGLDVEWAGHPNWFFLISKFSLPYLKHETVPQCWFLNEVPVLPEDLDNYVLKPLYSFAGLGVKVGPTRQDIEAIPQTDRSQYLLQRRMRFEPVIETPFGPTQAEIRVMYIWPETEGAALEPVSLIVRMGRGKMMGVDHNRDMEWVGASAGFIVESA
jgi:hypothetical protein